MDQPITPCGYKHITKGIIQEGDKFWFWLKEEFDDTGEGLAGLIVEPGDGRYIIRKVKEAKSIKKGLSKLARVAIKKHEK